MSGEALYERYKDALRRGHVASLSGKLEDALTAYAEAAAVAPERPTPHTSAGAALMRRRRYADALRSYAQALHLVPRDEAALLGRAQALVALGRAGEAADAFDRLAEVRTAADKLPEAADAARRALELAEGRERRQVLARLVERLGATDAVQPAPTPADASQTHHEAAVPEPPLQAVGGGAEPATGGREMTGPGGGEPGEVGGDPETEPRTVALRALPAGGPIAGHRSAEGRAALDRDLPVDLDPEMVARGADDAIDSGAHGVAIERLLDLAALRRRAGSIEAALDACYQGLALTPDSVDLHLALVRLYDDHGWRDLAAEKLDLLARLVAFDDDEVAAARVAEARTPVG